MRGGSPVDVVAEFREQPPEDAVEFEAVTATLALDDFLVEVRQGEFDALVVVTPGPTGDGERLEGDGRDVDPLEAFERVAARWFHVRVVETDPGEVAVGVGCCH